MKKAIIFLYLLVILTPNLSGQDKNYLLQEKLMILATGEIPALNEKVNISVTNISIQEFLRAVSKSTGLNINVAPDLNITVVNNFTNVRVLDILMFLCRQYDLNISIIGNIINVYKEKQEAPAPVKKQIVRYDQANETMSIESDNEDLGTLLKAIVNNTGFNVVPAPGLDNLKVKGYIQNMPVDNALDKFAFANNLKVRKTNDNVYLIERNDTPPQNQNNQNRGGSPGQKKTDGASGLQVIRISEDSVSISGDNISLSDIIRETASIVHANYFFTSPVTGETTLHLQGIRFPALLTYLFRNSVYSYQKIDGIYLIGDNKSHDLKEFRIIQLQYRTIDTLLTIIPSEYKKELELKEFPELNSLLVSGLPERINTLESFVRAIDKLIPNILIEVMIIDAKTNSTVTTGIEAGIGTPPATTSKVYPSLDFNLSSQSINNLINSFNGFGTVKIGNVTPDFYLSLKALEANGIINIRSTPKLSTLNGHSASMSIGNTEYYKEEQNNIYGSFTSQSQLITTYKDVKAELKVKIRPVVSGDDQITLEIEVTQEDFTSRISTYAPPGKVARTFKSLIRVKNQEMILLGGLEEKRNSDTSSGTPFLSRVPVIKWLFSSRSKTRSNSRLNIFIKPSIVE